MDSIGNKKIGNSRISQTVDCFKSRVKLFRNKGDWKFVLFGAVIAWLVAWVVGEDMFETYDSTKSGFFTIMSACIWIGIFNSIQLICKEKRIIQYEHRQLGKHISSYIIGNMFFEAVICLVQSAIILGICNIYIDFPTEGLVFSNALVDYFISFYLIILSADAMGMSLSCLVKTETAAMTIMPFVLILQLIMSGVLFTLEGAAEKISDFTIGKWGMAAVGSIGNLNSNELPLKISLVYPNVEKTQLDDVYEATSAHLANVWWILGAFIIGFILISIIRMEYIDRERV